MGRISPESEVGAMQPFDLDNAAVQFPLPHPGSWPLPAKALVTVILVMMSLGLLVAGAQIIVHDIIPTFLSDQPAMPSGHDQMEAPASERGDLFGGSMARVEKPPFYKSDGFIFALKFTHIHIFGMSAIFILMGVIVFFPAFEPRNPHMAHRPAFHRRYCRSSCGLVENIHSSNLFLAAHSRWCSFRDRFRPGHRHNPQAVVGPVIIKLRSLLLRFAKV